MKKKRGIVWDIKERLNKHPEESVVISWNLAKKLSQEQEIKGKIREDQKINFAHAERMREQGKTLSFFITGEDHLVGYKIDSFTRKLQKQWDLANENTWAIECLKRDDALSQLSNSPKSSLEAIIRGNGGGGRGGGGEVAEVAIDASKRLKMVFDNFDKKQDTLKIIKELILNDRSLNWIEKFFGGNKAALKKKSIEGIIIITDSYKKIHRIRT